MIDLERVDEVFLSPGNGTENDLTAVSAACVVRNAARTRTQLVMGAVNDDGLLVCEPYDGA